MHERDPVPESRVRLLNRKGINTGGRYVLYWMVASRRLDWNYAIDRATEHARELGRPLVVLEALRCGYPWASDRLHSFVLRGMAEHEKRLRGANVLYHPYVEPDHGAGRGLLQELSRSACVVVTDDFPAFFVPRMTAAAARKLDVRLEAVDANGLLPMRAPGRVFTTAHAFRRHLQRVLPGLLPSMPRPQPLRGLPAAGRASLPAAVHRRWPAATADVLAGKRLGQLPIDHDVPPTKTRGGRREALRLWRRFLAQRLPRYVDGRNDLEREATSGLSAHLHFGHISTHQLVHELLAHQGWSRELLAPTVDGSREGWWGVTPQAEAFLDQLVTWREVGFNMCAERGDHRSYESLPSWARETLGRHQDDPRPHLYDLDQLAAAETHDEIWNAAQRQLVREGRIHNYLRMLWGKKILEWTRRPREALEVMIALNDRYALDGRDPNSYSGILWTLGRYDRPWGPERPIFGKVRYMSSESTRRKLRLGGYLERYGPG